MNSKLFNIFIDIFNFYPSIDVWHINIFYPVWHLWRFSFMFYDAQMTLTGRRAVTFKIPEVAFVSVSDLPLYSPH